MTTEGIVLESLPGTTFKVRIDDDREILAYLSGKMRVRRIRITPGDRVRLELADLNSDRGRIVWRL